VRRNTVRCWTDSARGDEVVTSGGILGRVTDMSDAFITVEISDKLEIKVQKQAISAVLPKGTIKAA
jgi:preprotein translocase subunit YajC